MRYKRTDPKTQRSELWDFVCTIVDPSNSANTRFVLRSEDGKNQDFTQTAFHGEFTLVTAAISTTASDATKETLNCIRQNSTVRFATLPFFLSASVVLADAYKNEVWDTEPFVPILGLGLAIIGVIFEIGLSRNLICWWKAIKPKDAADPWGMVKAHRAEWILWPVRYALFAPYVAGIYYWILQIGRGPSWAVGSAAFVVVLSFVIWKFLSEPKPIEPKKA